MTKQWPFWEQWETLRIFWKYHQTKTKPLTKIDQTWQSKLFLGKVASLCIMAITTFVVRWNLNPGLFKPKIHINNPVDSLKWLERMYNFVQHLYQLIKNIFKSFLFQYWKCTIMLFTSVFVIMELSFTKNWIFTNLVFLSVNNQDCAVKIWNL